MAFITPQEKDRIAHAVSAAERKTSGEFVSVIAGTCDHYIFIPLLWAAITALLIPGVLLPLTGLGYVHIYRIQLVGFVLLSLIFSLPPIKMRLVPRGIRHERAAHIAHEQFYLQGVHLTEDHSGVLFFVSVAERYVEIVADRGIHDKVGEQRWREIVEQFTHHVRSGNIAEGFVTAIDACGAAMAQHYPHAADDVDELPNRLIEI